MHVFLLKLISPQQLLQNVNSFHEKLLQRNKWKMFLYVLQNGLDYRSHIVCTTMLRLSVLEFELNARAHAPVIKVVSFANT